MRAHHIMFHHLSFCVAAEAKRPRSREAESDRGRVSQTGRHLRGWHQQGRQGHLQCPLCQGKELLKIFLSVCCVVWDKIYKAQRIANLAVFKIKSINLLLQNFACTLLHRSSFYLLLYLNFFILFLHNRKKRKSFYFLQPSRCWMTGAVI